MIRKAVILAAGKGIRLMPLTRTTPKEMIQVGAKPVIERIIEISPICGIEEILIVLNPQKKALLDRISSWQMMGLNVSYCFQNKASGTAHAVYLGRKFVGEESFVVVYGDNYFESSSSFVRAIEFHQNRKADATLLLHYIKEPYHSGLVKLDQNCRILKIIEKPTVEEAISCTIGRNYVCVAGLHILEPLVFQFIEQTRAGRNGETWLTDTIELMRASCHNVYGVLSPEGVWDIGTPEMLRKARSHFRRSTKNG